MTDVFDEHFGSKRGRSEPPLKPGDLVWSAMVWQDHTVENPDGYGLGGWWRHAEDAHDAARKELDGKGPEWGATVESARVLDNGGIAVGDMDRPDQQVERHDL